MLLHGLFAALAVRRSQVMGKATLASLARHHEALSVFPVGLIV